MIKIAICDDEKNIRSYLTALVREQNTECEITEYDSAEKYISDGAAYDYDLLFLDIELNGSVSGVELAKQIRSMEQIRQPVIIFVTGYEKYVYDAFDVDALHYLVKPINERKFAEVFRRAQDKILSETEQKKDSFKKSLKRSPSSFSTPEQIKRYHWTVFITWKARATKSCFIRKMEN